MMELAQSQARLEQLEDEVESLTRARDLSQRAYQAGAITLTDVLEADRQLLVARNEVESTRSDAARAAVGTFRAWAAAGTYRVIHLSAKSSNKLAREYGIGNLIPMLANKYHVVAPDFPGYGESSAPSDNDFDYSFGYRL